MLLHFRMFTMLLPGLVIYPGQNRCSKQHLIIGNRINKKNTMLYRTNFTRKVSTKYIQFALQRNDKLLPLIFFISVQSDFSKGLRKQHSNNFCLQVEKFDRNCCG